MARPPQPKGAESYFANLPKQTEQEGLSRLKAAFDAASSTPMARLAAKKAEAEAARMQRRAPEIRPPLMGPGRPGQLPFRPLDTGRPPARPLPLGGSPGVTPMPSPGMPKPTQMPEMRTSPAPLTQAQMMQMMKSGGEVKREVDSLASRYPKKGIDPTIPAGVREKLVEQEREKMFKAGEKAHSERTLAKGGSAKAYAKGGVTRADGCVMKGRTKGRMV